MAKTAPKLSLDSRLEEFDRAYRLYAQLSEEESSRGKPLGVDPAAKKAAAATNRAVDRMIPYLADRDEGTRSKALLGFQFLGWWGVVRLAAGSPKARSSGRRRASSRRSGRSRAYILSSRSKPSSRPPAGTGAKTRCSPLRCRVLSAT